MINNAKFTRPAVSSGEERGLLSRTAAGNRAYEEKQEDVCKLGSVSCSLITTEIRDEGAFHWLMLPTVEIFLLSVFLFSDFAVTEKKKHFL